MATTAASTDLVVMGTGHPVDFVAAPLEVADVDAEAAHRPRRTADRRRGAATPGDNAAVADVGQPCGVAVGQGHDVPGRRRRRGGAQGDGGRLGHRGLAVRAGEDVPLPGAGPLVLHRHQRGRLPLDRPGARRRPPRHRSTARCSRSTRTARTRPRRSSTSTCPTRSAPPRPDPPELAETGHVALPQTSRRGEAATAWYRGPFGPLPTDRDPADSPLAHVSDQLRTLTPDGREDVEPGRGVRDRPAPRPLAAGAGRALVRWRSEQFGAARAHTVGDVVTKATPFTPDATRPGPDLGRLVGLQLMTMAGAGARRRSPGRPARSPTPAARSSCRARSTRSWRPGSASTSAGCRSRPGTQGMVAALAGTDVVVAGGGRIDQATRGRPAGHARRRGDPHRRGRGGGALGPPGVVGPRPGRGRGRAPRSSPTRSTTCSTPSSEGSRSP